MKGPAILVSGILSVGCTPTVGEACPMAWIDQADPQYELINGSAETPYLVVYLRSSRGGWMLDGGRGQIRFEGNDRFGGGWTEVDGPGEILVMHGNALAPGRVFSVPENRTARIYDQSGVSCRLM